MGVAEPCGLVPWGGGGLGHEVAARVRPESAGAGVSAGRSVGSRWLCAWLRETRMGGGLLGGSGFLPSPGGSRWAPGTRTCVHRGGQAAGGSLSVCRCLCPGRGAAPGRGGGRQGPHEAGKGAWRPGRVGRSSTAPAPPCGLAPYPVPPGFAEAVETPPPGGRCAPALRSGPPGRGPAERTQRHRPPWAAGPGVSRPGPVRARAPAAGQPGEQVGGRHPPASAPGEGPDPPGDRPRAAARRKQSGTRSGHAAPALVCEAIDTAARRRPTRRDDIPLRPGAQDAGRGQPGAPSNKTSSLRHNFQGCPRHAWQPMHSTFRRTGELFMECSE